MGIPTGFSEVNGIKLLTQDDMVVHHRNRTGEFEPSTTSIWRSICKSCNNSHYVIDVGAYTGYYSILSKLTNPSVHVIAFEPNKRSFDRINENLALNNIPLDSVNAINIAVSYFIGEVGFNYRGNIAMSSGCHIDNKSKIKIPVDRIDSYMVEGKQCKAIKIDVENFEIDALLGCEDIIRKDYPALIVECLKDDLLDTIKKLLQEKHGYSEATRIDGRNFLFTKNHNNS